MYKRAISFIAIFTIMACLMPDAVGCQPFINTTDSVHNIIYYHNGTVSYGPGIGTIVVTNPSLISPIIAVNLTLLNGTTRFIGSMNPPSIYIEDYTIEYSEISIPLKLSDTVIPSSLYTGVQQEIRLYVEIENTGSGNITGFWYQKALPPGLSVVWTAYEGGILHVNDDNVTWTMDTLIPGEKKHLVIAFNVTPTANVYFPAASLSYLYLAPLAPGEPGLSGYTNTSFHIKKSHPSNEVWYLEASVPNDSDLNMNLSDVCIYRSDASDPFTVSEIASYTPNVILCPGSAWNTSIIDNYSQVPTYFIKIAYTIPYTLNRRSFLTAETEQSIIAVSSPLPTAMPPPTISYSNPYATRAPTVTPTPALQPMNPDIVFVKPDNGSVITNNTTEIETSVPPSSDPGYVVYYGSTDNRTWTRIGESNVEGNVSELIWSVPQMNGKYYLKAEHYNSLGLRGVAYTQVLIAHEILPVGITTMLISGMDWLMLLLLLIALVLMLFIIIPYFTR